MDFEHNRHWLEQVIIYTRHWMHYGFLAFVFVLVAVAAATGLLQAR